MLNEVVEERICLLFPQTVLAVPLDLISWMDLSGVLRLLRFCGYNLENGYCCVLDSFMPDANLCLSWGGGCLGREMRAGCLMSRTGHPCEGTYSPKSPLNQQRLTLNVSQCRGVEIQLIKEKVTPETCQIFKCAGRGLKFKSFYFAKNQFLPSFYLYLHFSFYKWKTALYFNTEVVILTQRWMLRVSCTQPVCQLP